MSRPIAHAFQTSHSEELEVVDSQGVSIKGGVGFGGVVGAAVVVGAGVGGVGLVIELLR
jgi:hypothetical protein